MNFFFVALGGAAGACGRYAISLIPVKTQFPVLTLVTKVLSEIVIGVVVACAEDKKDSKNAILFLKTGVCGGFTTFSTFSLEAYNLFMTKNYGLCGLYVFLSVAGCIAGVWLGKKIYF